MPGLRSRPTRNASGLMTLLNVLGWSGRDAAQKLGISHPTLIGLREGTVRPGQVVIDTVTDHLRAYGYQNIDADALFPRDDKPEEDDRDRVTTAAG